MKTFEEHTDYIKKKEYEVVDELLANPEAFNDISQLGGFAITAYNRVVDMFELDDFASCQQLVMVGCGPFPMTALHIVKKYPNIKIDALDIDCSAVDTAQKLIDCLGLNDNIRLYHNNGLTFDYSEASIVYVANLVRPKSAVLQKIHLCCKSNTLVVLRDPTKTGDIYAESGLSSIDDSFSVEGFGCDDETFHSRHVFLRCQ